MTALTLLQRPKICDDLVPVIIETNDDRWWPCDFQRLALVGPAWLGPVRKRLYAFPTVRSFRQCTLLARTLRENPQLLGLLSGIDLRPLSESRSYGSSSSSSRNSNNADMASLRFLLGVTQRTPNCKLVLAGDLAIKAERFLRAIAAPHAIIELHIDGNLLTSNDLFTGASGSNTKVASLRWDAALASAFPALHRLRLCNLELEVPHAPASHATSTTVLRPREVALENVCVQGDLRHLADLSRLRALRIACECPMELGAQMAAVLEACAGSLESLHYEAQDAHNDPSMLAEYAAVDFPLLTELSIVGVRCDADALLAVGRRCGRLRRLAVGGRTVQIPHEEWANVISSGVFSALRELTVPRGTYQPPFARFTSTMTETISGACRLQGVKLVV